MSQQSNPATLREALAREIVDEFCGGSEAVFEAILAKLAASSTEAAPMCRCGDHAELCARCGQCLLVCCECEDPAQAAASPEGEGREALLKLRSYNVDILAGRINYRPQDHIDVIDAALRQSAAPSGVDLREALAIVAEEMQGALSARTGLVHKDYIKRWLEMIALAASGTEAAPVTCESCKSTNTQRYENAGGLKMYSCADCGWHHEVPAQAAASPEAAPGNPLLKDAKKICTVVYDHANQEIRYEKPAAASPEGEGRIVATQSTISLAHSAFKGLPPTICGSLRQSAAPSGGAARLPSVSELSEYLQDVEGWDEHYIAEECLKAIKLWLAQESKTGVKHLKKQVKKGKESK